MRQRDRFTVSCVAAACLVALLGAPASAQSQARRATPAQQTTRAVTQDDIQRLEQSVYDIDRSINRLRPTDSELAGRLQERLDSVRDEVTYLKVKLRKEGRVSRDEFADTRERLAELRSQALNGSAGAYEPYARSGESQPRGNEPLPRGTAGAREPYPNSGAPYPDADEPAQQSRSARPNEVPVGTELDIRLQTPLSSGTSQVEDPFEATTLVDLMSGDRVLVPAGSTVRGVVAQVDKAGRLDRKGHLALKIDQLSVNHRSYPIRATVTDALENGGYKQDAGKIGAGAGVGAIIGGILGGAKGALAGILIGGGGVVAATEGQDVDLPAGTVLRIRFDEGLLVR